MQWETFASLANVDCVSHAFTLRTQGNTKTDPALPKTLQSIGFPPNRFVAAEQPHGSLACVVDEADCGTEIPRADALITKVPALPLVIRCADCATVYIVNKAIPAIGLVHSGKKGTQANIVLATLSTMKESFNANPHDCIAVISPCIGPCHYEVNLWDAIEDQLKDAGVPWIFNQRICTACHLDRYYSYRSEKGNTGRMFAVLTLN